MEQQWWWGGQQNGLHQVVAMIEDVVKATMRFVKSNKNDWLQLKGKTLTFEKTVKLIWNEWVHCQGCPVSNKNRSCFS